MIFIAHRVVRAVRYQIAGPGATGYEAADAVAR
jgi:hypothetical protein